MRILFALAYACFYMGHVRNKTEEFSYFIPHNIQTKLRYNVRGQHPQSFLFRDRDASVSYGQKSLVDNMLA